MPHSTLLVVLSLVVLAAAAAVVDPQLSHPEAVVFSAAPSEPLLCAARNLLREPRIASAWNDIRELHVEEAHIFILKASLPITQDLRNAKPLVQDPLCRQAVLEPFGTGSFALRATSACVEALVDTKWAKSAFTTICLQPSLSKLHPHLVGPTEDRVAFLHQPTWSRTHTKEAAVFCVKGTGMGSAPTADAIARRNAEWEVHTFGKSSFAITACCGRNVSCVDESVAVAMHAVPGVIFVEPHYPVGMMHNKFSRGLMESGVVFKEPMAEAGILGVGYVVGVADTGIDYDHCFFDDPNYPTLPYDQAIQGHRKIVRYQRVNPSAAGSGGDFREGHGTHVAGTVAGIPTDMSNANASFHGVAPGAKISFYDLSGFSNEGVSLPSSLTQLFSPAYQDGARIHTNSWGSSAGGSYSSMSLETDSYVHNSAPDMLIIFSAGNEADKACEHDAAANLRCDRFTVTSPSTCKNCLSVGASMAPYLSWKLAAYGNFVMWAMLGGERRPMQAARADFGPKSIGDGIRNKVLRWTTDDKACTTNLGDLMGVIAVTRRGECHFEDKAKRIQTAGAVAMVVVNYEPGDPFTMGSSEDSGAGMKGVLIPSFMIGLEDGKLIETALKEGRVTASILTAGADDPHKNEENLSSFSSHGPTEDMRYKPDLVSVGEFVHSAYSDASLTTKNCNLWPSMGTSMSAPLIAGTATLVREYFERGFYVDGTEGSGPKVSPKSDLMRATLIHASRALRGFYDRNTQGDWRQLNRVPSFEQGHGIPNMNHTLPIGAGSTARFVFDQSSVVMGTGDEIAYCVYHDGAANGEFRAVLTWTDPPGAPAARHVLVNNLDLIVVAPDGREYHGNMHRPDTLQFDVLNNVEKVTAPPIEKPGTYHVRIRGTNIATGTQSFAVVLSGTNTSCHTQCGACVHGTCDAGSGNCVCEPSWAGSLCDIPIVTMSPGEFSSISLQPMEWAYFAIHSAASTTTPKIHLKFRSIDSLANPNYFVTEGTLPTLMNANKISVTSDTTCDNCPGASTTPKTYGDLEVASADKVYIVGVISMCCYNASVRLQLTTGSTKTISVLGVRAVSDTGAKSAQFSGRVVLPIGANRRIQIKGTFKAAKNITVTAGPETRDEVRCDVSAISDKYVTCTLERLTSRFEGQRFGLRVTVDGVMSVPSHDMASLDIGSAGSEPVPTPAPAASGPTPSNAPSPSQELVAGLSKEDCGDSCADADLVHKMVYPCTAVSHGLVLHLYGYNFTMATYASISGVALVVEGTARTVNCALRGFSHESRVISCLANTGIEAGTRYHVRVSYRSGAVEDVPPSVATIIVMIETEYSGIAVGFDQDAALAAAPAFNFEAPVWLTMTPGIRLVVRGKHFDFEMNATLSSDFVIQIVVGTTKCTDVKILNDYALGCRLLEPGTGFPADTPIPVHITGQAYAVLRHTTFVKFNQRGEVTGVMGTKSTTNPTATVVSSYVLNVVGNNLFRGSLMIEIFRNEKEIPCTVAYLNWNRVQCIVNSSARSAIVTGQPYTLSVTLLEPKENRIVTFPIEFAKRIPFITGVGSLSETGPFSHTTRLGLPTGTVPHATGAMLYISGEYLSALPGSPVVILRGVNDKDDYGCRVKNFSDSFIACEVSQYVFGMRQLAVVTVNAEHPQGLPVPSETQNIVYFTQSEASPMALNTKLTIREELVFYGVESSLRIELQMGLPSVFYLSTTGCGLITPANGTAQYESHLDADKDFTINESPATISVCASPNGLVHLFYYPVAPSFVVWQIESLFLESNETDAELVEAKGPFVPSGGWPATKSVPKGAQLYLSTRFFAENFLQVSQGGLEFSMEFALDDSPTCDSTASVTYGDAITTTMDAASRLTLLRHVIHIPHNVNRLRTLCMRLTRQGTNQKSSQVPLARIPIASCSSAADCNNLGDCVDTTADGKPMKHCECHSGFGGDYCDDVCPSTEKNGACDGHGTCQFGICHCEADRYGAACQFSGVSRQAHFADTFENITAAPRLTLPRSPSATRDPSSDAASWIMVPFQAFHTAETMGKTMATVEVMLYTHGATNGGLGVESVTYDGFLWQSPRTVGSPGDAVAEASTATVASGKDYVILRFDGMFLGICSIAGRCTIGLLVTVPPAADTDTVLSSTISITVDVGIALREGPLSSLAVPSASWLAARGGSHRDNSEDVANNACADGGCVSVFAIWALIIGVVAHIASCMCIRNRTPKTRTLGAVDERKPGGALPSDD